jgi:4-cresol dehydrogenase (hydroxylating)
MDPDRYGCGLLWCSPVAPADGLHAGRLTTLSSQLLLRHGFEPAISLTMITDRTLACIISIAYDREVPGEDAKVLACYHELLQMLAQEGYPSYRLSIGAMNAVPDQPSYNGILQTLKSALDPNGILAPGRYIAAPLSSAARSGSEAGRLARVL